MISSQTIFEQLCSTGSSGSLLYYTRDGEFIVKTIRKKEYHFLKTMLVDYLFYMKENPLTFLPKLLGCYILSRKYKKKVTNIYFIVMTNVFATENHIDLRFDLKGSTIGRKVLPDTNINITETIQGDMALKDLDFNRLNEKINLGKRSAKILSQIKKDVEFLCSKNSNDYSLLLGIHKIKRNTDLLNTSIASTHKTRDFKLNNSSLLSEYTKDSTSSEIKSHSNISSQNSAVERINKINEIYDLEDGGILSDNKEKIYYLGIIDIFTEFRTAKKFEYLFKKLIYCSMGMSCVPPKQYKERFFNYLQSIFLENNNNNTDGYVHINQNLEQNQKRNNDEEKEIIDASIQNLYDNIQNEIH